MVPSYYIKKYIYFLEYGFYVIGSHKIFPNGQDLGIVLRCYSLNFFFKILLCKFFPHGMKVYFLVK